MGRPRKSRKDLPQRVYLKHGAYYFIHVSGKWERLAALGQEREMRVAWANLEQPNQMYGTTGALIDEYLSKYAAIAKAPRTYSDNLKESEYLKAYFGEMQPQHIQARHVGAYLEANRETRPVRANREKALLSHIFTWAMRHPNWGCTIQHNPCRGVVRNKETKRIRIIYDDEYMSVYNLANNNVKRLMTLVYRTLQRPSDILKFGPNNIVNRLVDGKMIEVLSFEQGKTKKIVEIILSGDLRAALYGPYETLDNFIKSQTNRVEDQFFLVNRDGKPYCLDGIDSNFRRALNKYREQAKTITGIKPKTFGLYDLKGKGVTDMYQAGISLTYIQALAGHESVTTTEIYIKARLNKPIVSNTRKIGN
jgi:site-specific recombinase XerD